MESQDLHPHLVRIRQPPFHDGCQRRPSQDYNHLPMVSPAGYLDLLTWYFRAPRVTIPKRQVPTCKRLSIKLLLLACWPVSHWSKQVTWPSPEPMQVLGVGSLHQSVSSRRWGSWMEPQCTRPPLEVCGGAQEFAFLTHFQVM